MTHAEDILGAYIARLARTNEKLRFWRRHSEERLAAHERFSWLGIPLWDVHMGRLAPLDMFGVRGPAAQAALTGPSWSPGRMMTLFRRFKYVPRARRPARSVMFVGYQRRQLGNFAGTMQILRDQGVPVTVATTSAPTSSFVTPVAAEEIASVESFVSPGIAAGACWHYRQVDGWLEQLGRNQTPAAAQEVGVIISALRSRLLYSLFMLGASRAMLRRLRPACILTADDSDLRARTLCLLGRQLGIPSFHAPYGYLNYDCFEESYPTADKKLVFSEQQRALLVDCFGVPPQNVEAVGAPRFDYLFGLRRHHARAGLRTIVLGSQTEGTASYSPLTRESKAAGLQTFFQAVGALAPRPQILYRPHPEESADERAAVHALAAAAGVVMTTLETLDFAALAREVDLFVTFFSTLALEFLILGIPAVYLTSVSSIQILKASCAAGVAREVLTREAWDSFLRNGGIDVLTARSLDASHYVDVHFFNGGKASAALAARVRHFSQEIA